MVVSDLSCSMWDLCCSWESCVVVQGLSRHGAQGLEHKAHRIFVPDPGIEPGSTRIGGRCFNLWATRELTWSISHFYSISTHRRSCVWLFVIPWTVTHQALLSMEFSRQEYQDGLPFPSPGDLPEPGFEPRSPTFQADSLPSEPPRKPFQTQAKEPQWTAKTFKIIFLLL